MWFPASQSSVGAMAMTALERPVERRLCTLAPLVVDDGCDVRFRGGVQDAVRVALLEWLPLTTGELHAAEDGLPYDLPMQALAVVVRPPTIWTTEEALAATVRVRLGDEHLGRLRGAAVGLMRQLPVAEFPVAGSTIARGCAAIAADDDACAAVARALLARYAASAFVAASRKEAAPTMN